MNKILTRLRTFCTLLNLKFKRSYSDSKIIEFIDEPVLASWYVAVINDGGLRKYSINFIDVYYIYIYGCRLLWGSSFAKQIFERDVSAKVSVLNFAEKLENMRIDGRIFVYAFSQNFNKVWFFFTVLCFLIAWLLVYIGVSSTFFSISRYILCICLILLSVLMYVFLTWHQRKKKKYAWLNDWPFHLLNLLNFSINLILCFYYFGYMWNNLIVAYLFVVVLLNFSLFLVHVFFKKHVLQVKSLFFFPTISLLYFFYYDFFLLRTLKKDKRLFLYVYVWWNRVKTILFFLVPLRHSPLVENCFALLEKGTFLINVTAALDYDYTEFCLKCNDKRNSGNCFLNYNISY